MGQQAAGFVIVCGLFLVGVECVECLGNGSESLCEEYFAWIGDLFIVADGGLYQAVHTKTAAPFGKQTIVLNVANTFIHVQIVYTEQLL